MVSKDTFRQIDSAEAKIPSTYFSPQVQVAIRLNSNESPYSLPVAWQKELASAVESIQFNRYPDRFALNLRSALANYHSKNVENIFVANGSNEVIQSIYLALSIRSKVGLFEPTYLLHSHIANILGVPVVQFLRNDEFKIDKSTLDNVVSNRELSIIMLCSPNNPTGNCEDLSTVEYICSNFDGVVVLDEAYVQFSNKSGIELLEKYENLIVIRTFSKTWSAAGLRLGYCIGSGTVIERLQNVSLPYHLDSIKQVAGILALEYQDEIQLATNKIINQRNETYKLLKKLPLQVYESEANFIMFRPLNKQSQKLFNALIEKSILIRYLDSFFNLEPALRVTMGTPEEMDRFHEALEDCLKYI